MHSQLASPVLVQGYFYGINGNNGGAELRCLELGNGALKWKQKIGGGTLIAASGFLVAVASVVSSSWWKLLRRAIVRSRAHRC